MNTLRQEATELLAALPEQKLSSLITYMKSLQRELQQEMPRTTRHDIDIRKYTGSAGKLFGSKEEIDEYVNEMRGKNSNIQRKRAALQEIIAMREQSPFPKDFDYDKALEEALSIKYGRFD